MLFLLSTGLDTGMLSILLRHTKSYQTEIILSVPISVNVTHVHKSPKFPFWEWNAFGVLWSRISICVPAVPISHLVTNCILCQFWIMTAPILPVLYVILNVLAEIPYSHLLVPKISWPAPVITTGFAVSSSSLLPMLSLIHIHWHLG